MERVKATLLFVLLLVSTYSMAQVNITSYSSSSIAVGTNKYKSLSAELKLFANTNYQYVKTEVDCFYNFKPKSYHKVSVGVGLNFEPFKNFDQFRAFTIPLAIEITPFKDIRCLSFMVELAPELVVEDQVQIRHLWGIRYTFGE